MSYESDQRVVQLTFDNKRFEANVSQTLGSLEKLKDSLKFDGAEKGFDSLEKASKDIDFGRMADNVDYIASRFTFLGKVVDQVKDKIVSGLFGAVSSIKSQVESMTAIGQLGGAWAQYAEQVSAVQTIMAATREQFNEAMSEADRMEAVNAQMERLQWFTDETSYNLLDMVSNIGKFTAQSVRLDKAVTNMEGIAVWTSLSGGNVQKATTAMEVFSKALGTGYVELQRWQQLETANLVTTEFKNTLLEVAEAQGTLKKKADGVWETLNGTEVTFSNLNQTLTKGKWFTSDVVDALFTKYGAFANKLSEVYNNVNELSTAGEVTTSTLIAAVKELKNGETEGDNFRKVLARTGLTAEELHEQLDILAQDEYDLGFRAMQAAQEAKTFGEAIDSVGTAVRTGWAKSFEIIFGDYLEAKELWSDLANYLWDVFNGGAEARNEILALWKAAGGRDDVIQMFRNLAAAVESIVEPIKRAWDAVFNPGDDKEMNLAKKLWTITHVLEQLTRQMKLGEEGGEGLTRVFTLLFTPIKWVGSALKVLVVLLAIAIRWIGIAAEHLLIFFGSLQITRQGVIDFIESSRIAQGVIMALAAALLILLSPVIALGFGIYKLVNYFSQFQSVSQWWSSLKEAHPWIQQLISAFGELGHAIGQLFGGLTKYLPTLDEVKTLGAGVLGFIMSLPGYLAKGASAVATFISNFAKMVSAIANGDVTFEGFGVNIVQGLVNGIVSAGGKLGEIGTKIFLAVANAFRAAAGIHSPSLVFKLLGGMLVAGLILGMLGAASQLGDAGETLFGSLASRLETAGVDSIITSFVRSLDRGLQTIQAILAPLNKAFTNFFENLNAGQITVLIFAGAFAYLSTRIGKFVTSVTEPFTKLASSIAGFVGNINGVLKGATNVMNTYAETMKKTASANNLLTYAKAIGILAASLVVLGIACSGDNWKNIARGGIALAVLMGALAGFSALMKKLGSIEGLAAVGFSFLAIAVSVGILVGAVLKLIAALKILEALGGSVVWEFVGAIGALIAIMAALVAALIILDKHTNSIVSVSGSILLFVIAINMLVNAMIKLGLGIKAIVYTTNELGIVKIDWGPFFAAIGGIIVAAGVLVAGLAILSKHTAQMVATGVSLFLFAKAISSVVNTLVLIQKVLKSGEVFEFTWTRIWHTFIVLAEVAAIMFTAALALRIAGKAMASAGLGLAAGVIALGAAILMFKNIDPENVEAIKKLFGSVIDAISTLMSNMTRVIAIYGLLSIFNATLKGLGKAFLAMGVTIAIMVGAFKLAEYLDPNKIKLTATIFGILILVMGLALLLGSEAGEAAKAIKEVRNFLIALTVCLGLLSMFMNGDPMAMIAPGIALALGLAALAGMLVAISKITEKVKTAPLIAMLVGVGMVCTTLIWLSYMPMESVLASAFSVIGTLLALAVMLKVLSSMEGSFLKTLGSVAILALVIGELYLVGLVLRSMADLDWAYIMSNMLAPLGIVMGGLVAILALLGVVGNLAGTAILGVLELALVIAELFAVGLVLRSMADLDWAYIMSNMLAPLGIVMGGLIVILALLGVVGFLAGTAILGILELALVIAELFAVGLVLRSMADLDWNYIMTNMLAPLGIVMAGLIGILALLGVVGFLAGTAILGILELALIIGELYLVGLVLQQLTMVDWATVQAMMIPLGIIMAAMIGIVAILGLIAPLAEAAILGIISLVLLSADLIIIAFALQQLTTVDWEAVNTAMTGITSVITSMLGLCTLLTAMAAFVLGGSAVILAIAANLIVLGNSCATFGANTQNIQNDVDRVKDAINSIGELEQTAPPKAIAAIQAIQTALTTQIDIMQTVCSIQMTVAGQMLGAGLMSGMLGTTGVVNSAAVALFGSAYTGFASAAQINSPSKVFEWLGQMMGIGSGSGLASTAGINNAVGTGIAQTTEAGYGSELDNMYSSGATGGYAFAQGANDQQPAAAQAGENLGQSMWNKFKGWLQKVAKALGILNDETDGEAGISNLMDKVENAVAGIGGGGGSGESLGDTIKNGLLNALGLEEGQSFEDLFNFDDMFGGGGGGGSGFEDMWSNMGGGAGGAAGGLDDFSKSAGGAGGSAKDMKEAVEDLEVSTEDLTDDEKELKEKIKELYEQKEAGLITDEEFTEKVKELTDAFKEDRRQVNELYDAYMNGEITLDEFNSKLQSLNEKAKEAVFKQQMDDLVLAFKEGSITEEEFDSKMRRLTGTIDEGLPSLDELNKQLQNGTINGKEFAATWDKIKEAQKEADTKARIDSLVQAYRQGYVMDDEFDKWLKTYTDTLEDDTIPTIAELNYQYQNGAITAKELADGWEKIKKAKEEAKLKEELYRLKKQFDLAEISRQEFLEGVNKLTKGEEKNYTSLKQLDDEFDRGMIDVVKYAEAIQDLYEDEDNLNMTMEELIDRFGSFENLPATITEALESITDNKFDLNEDWLNEASVLRFGQGIAQMFNKAIYGGESKLGDKLSDYALRRTEELMLQFYKMQNPLDANIQSIESWSKMSINAITEVAKAWGEYVTSAYDAMYDTNALWNNPSWQNDEFTLFDDMTKHMDDYLLGQEDWYKAMEDLAERGLDPELWQDLMNEGVNGLAKTLSLSHLSDAELEEINKRQENMRQVAKENAEKLAAISVMVANQAGHDAIASFVEGFVYDPEMDEEIEATTKEITDVFMGSIDHLVEMLQNGDINIDTFMMAVADIIGEDGELFYDTGSDVGNMLAEGIGDGVDAMTEYAVDAVSAMAEQMIAEVMRQIREAQADFTKGDTIGAGAVGVSSKLAAVIATVDEIDNSVSSALASSSTGATRVQNSVQLANAHNRDLAAQRAAGNTVNINNNFDVRPETVYEEVTAASITAARRVK